MTKTPPPPTVHSLILDPDAPPRLDYETLEKKRKKLAFYCQKLSGRIKKYQDLITAEKSLSKKDKHTLKKGLEYYDLSPNSNGYQA